MVGYWDGLWPWVYRFISTREWFLLLHKGVQMQVVNGNTMLIEFSSHEVFVTGMVGYHVNMLGVFGCICHNDDFRPEVMDRC